MRLLWVFFLSLPQPMAVYLGSEEAVKQGMVSFLGAPDRSVARRIEQMSGIRPVTLLFAFGIVLITGNPDRDGSGHKPAARAGGFPDRNRARADRQHSGRGDRI
jgi:hypothetical protein